MILAKNRLAAGWECQQRGELDNAQAIYRSVIRDFPSKPEPWIYLGMCLNDQTHYHEALAAYQRALVKVPDNENALVNRGVTLGMLGRYQDAINSHLEAISLMPNHARAHTNLGIELLRACQSEERESAKWQKAWSEYRWRIKTAVFTPPNYLAPFWQGEALAGKHLIIHGEQGLGDEIQTSRYVNELRRQAKKITLAADRKLNSLFIRSFPDIDVVERGESLPDADYQVCAFNLPLYFGHGQAQPYLSADPHNRRKWASDLANMQGPKIGICWTGNPQNPMNSLRSIPFSMLISALGQHCSNLVSLQTALHQEETSTLPDTITIYAPVAAPNHTEQPRSIDEMASIISCLDLVISCDSLSAHLAGGLGVETWLLLAAVPDWRWGLDTTSSKWYQHHRLFRQTKMGDWRDVCSSLSDAMNDFNDKFANLHI